MAQQISDPLAAFDAADLSITVRMPEVTDRADGALPGLTVVLPCFDEADNVADAIRAATAAAERCARSHQIVVVDDGSSDSTTTVAAALAARDPRVRLVVHARNQGYGDAVRSGIAAATEPWILLTDADLQFDLGELRLMLQLTIDHDLVAGYRIDRADPPARRFAAHAWNRLMRHSFGVAVRDVDCAFKLIHRDMLDGLDFIPADCRAVAAVGLVPDQPDAAVHHGDRRGNRGGPVARPVVDDDDLLPPARLLWRGDCLADGLREVLLLVVGGSTTLTPPRPTVERAAGEGVWVGERFDMPGDSGGHMSAP
jgi:Glycosyl transferase family 2